MHGSKEKAPTIYIRMITYTETHKEEATWREQEDLRKENNLCL